MSKIKAALTDNNGNLHERFRMARELSNHEVHAMSVYEAVAELHRITYDRWLQSEELYEEYLKVFGE